MGDPLGILPAPALAPEPAPIPAPPVGTLSAAVSQLAPAPIAATAPEPRFPDQKAGTSIRLTGTDGAVGDGVFIQETPEGQAVVRVDGEEYTLSPFDFDRARGEATRIDEEAKAAAKGQATAKPAPATRDYAAEGRTAFEAGAERRPPADLVSDTAGQPGEYVKAATEWTQAWDRANLAAPMPEADNANPPAQPIRLHPASPLSSRSAPRRRSCAACRRTRPPTCPASA